MAIRSEAQKRAVAKYNAKAYDQTVIRLKKGKLGIIKATADKQGESLNGYICTAIDERLERDNGETV